jgi:hypothetical protein
MKKSDLKQLIKPLVKECIHEVLLEEGLLSNVVSEVAKGMQGSLITESSVQPAPRQKALSAPQTREKISEHRKKLMHAIGSDSYNGVNLFEDTAPLTSNEPKQGAVDLGNPHDSGVDISSLVGDASKIWGAMK